MEFKAKPPDEQDFSLPDNPILRTANMVKAIHWYPGDDKVGSTHCTGKVLEWVGKTPLDESPENPEAREVLVDWMRLLAAKVVRPPFDDSDSALRLIECALNIQVSIHTRNYLENIRQQIIAVQDKRS